MRIHYIFTILVSLLTVQICQAQDNEWIPRNDGLDNRQVYCLAINPDDPDELYAGTEGGLFHSTNRGERWSSLSAGLPVRSVWVSSDGATVLAARAGGSRSDGIWISRNGGNFEVLTWILWPYAIAVNPDDEAQIFCGSRDRGFIYTLNGGGRWDEANNGMEGGTIYHLGLKNLEDETYVFASTERGVYRCTVDDFRWEEAEDLWRVYQTAFSYEEDEGIFAGTGDETDSDGLYYSDNLGDEWNVVRWGQYVRAVETMPNLVIMGSTEIGVWRSLDNGENWIEMNQELDDLDITDLLLQRYDDDCVCYLSNNGDGVFSYTFQLENDPPGAFTLLSPVDSDTALPDGEHQIPFTWQPSIDPNEDDVSYSIYFSFMEDIPFAEDIADTTWIWDLDDWDIEMDIPFHENIVWWVIASDGEEETECEERFTFYLDEPDWPPEPFGLLEPANNDTVEFTFTTFRWEETHDIDNDDVSYRFLLRDAEDHLYQTDLDATELTVGFDTLGINLTPGSQAIWYVIAMSGDTSTRCDEWFRFLYLPRDHAPGTFSLLEPQDGASFATALITFRWEASQDPDPGDEVRYEWTIAQGRGEYRLELDTTVLTIDIDTTEFGYRTEFPIAWHVISISDTMRTRSNESFSFTILPHAVGETTSADHPDGFQLYPPRPNPFNQTVSIEFALPAVGDVEVAVFDALGREVAHLAETRLASKSCHTYVWNAEGCESGVYFARVRFGAQVKMTKLVLIK